MTHKERNAERKRAWYKENRSVQIERVARNKKTRREFNDGLKMHPCTDCGFLPIVAEQMHWDHVPDRGEKLLKISQVVKDISMSRLQKELEKCDLVCANCHALRTYSRRILSRSQMVKAPI